MDRYPLLEINLGHLEHNVKTIVEFCKDSGVEVSGVIKGVNSEPEVARVYEKCGVKHIASSRIGQLKRLKDEGIKTPLMLIRISMLSEVEEVIKYTDVSLESDKTVVRALNVQAKAQGKVHKVILMADIGDLREGFWDRDELAEFCLEVEAMENIELYGVGTNLGCYGSVAPTASKLQELVDIAELIEAKIGRKLECISGGASSSLMRIVDGNLPKRINNLRVGETILLNYDLPEFYGYEIPGLYRDVFKLKLEVVECREKPTHPVGELILDPLGRKNVYEDRGIRKRAIVAAGRADFGPIVDLLPTEEGIEVVGTSSDHTILDVQDAKRDIKTGDIVEFSITYVVMLFLTQSKDIFIKYI